VSVDDIKRETPNRCAGCGRTLTYEPIDDDPTGDTRVRLCHVCDPGTESKSAADARGREAPWAIARSRAREKRLSQPTVGQE
jgi:hypothetical protein